MQSEGSHAAYDKLSGLVRKALGSATLATKAVAKAGPTPGMSSSPRLSSLDRCQALIMRSNCRICAFCVRNWAPRAANLGQPLIICIGSNPEQLLDTLASDRRDDPKLCKISADGIDHRMFGLVTASQIASASVASFLCRFTYGFT